MLVTKLCNINITCTWLMEFFVHCYNNFLISHLPVVFVVEICLPLSDIASAVLHTCVMYLYARIITALKHCIT